MNLLYDDLIRVQTVNGVRRVSLPELLTALGKDEIQGYVGIQRHQEDAFHVFLCYLAGAILARSDDWNPVQGAEYWRNGMQQLAGEAGDDAWALIVADTSRPAFMQPSIPPEDVKRLSIYASTSDALDLLPTAKNHDVKATRAAQADVDQWIFALISLQTMSGFFGRGNQGISRMNGGFGNRFLVEIIRTTSLGGRWHDAVTRLQEHRRAILDAAFDYDKDGLVLVWLEPWDGFTSIPLKQLDPFYIEICRRIRLTGDHAISLAQVVSAEKPRIDAKELKGVVGDAWAPIVVNESKSKTKEPDIKALTVSAQGITAEILRDIIFEEAITTTALHRPAAGWQGQLWLHASVLVRGQGTTDGFFERQVLIPGKARTTIFSKQKNQRQPLADISKRAIETASAMEYRVLKPAVFSYLEGGPETLMIDRKAVQAWWEPLGKEYETLWSDHYFPWLWSLPEEFDQETEISRWVESLRQYALSVLSHVEDSMPSHTGRGYRSITQAERIFWGALYNNFPILKEMSEHVSDS